MSSILSALMGGGQGGPAGPSIQVQSPGQGQQGSQASQGGGDGVSALKQALQAIHTFVEDADDEQDRQTALQCYAKLQSILANEQKEREAMMGTTPAHRGMAKAVTRGGGGY